MMKLYKNSQLIRSLALLIIIAFVGCKETTTYTKEDKKTVASNDHPKLILTKKGVAEIRRELGHIPIFDNSLKLMQEEVDAEMAMGIDTPIPKDFSGGYTHSRHKRNFLLLQKAGVLYQILEDEKYANYVKEMLLQYEAMYKTLPVHPQTRSYARGKLFWQCLNDSNWLVYAAQAYDCIYNYLSPEEREKLEKNLFRPFADFISIENPQFYNRVHNHSTWGNAAVGMIGLVMDDEELINRALYGIENDGLDPEAKDNDGGFIKNKDGKAGFLANLEEPFSPDGYYTEGPYYQRYAMYPFLIFAEGLHNAKPDFKIFEYKNGVLLKAVTALLNLSDADGEFFPLNDGQKGMSYHTSSLVSAVDIAYHYGGNNPELLSIAKKQNLVTIDDAGLAVALGIKNGKTKPFLKKSIELTDGPNGKAGAVAVLRKGAIELVYKYPAHGLSHGHFDKLSYSLYDSGAEVIQDYGLARFVNIEQKGGGNYLKENTTWAKQTIAHNTLVQNEVSHFQGKYEIGAKYHSEKYLFSIEDTNVQIASAKEVNAYPGTKIHRTMVLIKEEELPNPYVLDIVRVESDHTNQYDLPFYYLGQLMQTNFTYNTPKSLSSLGKANGYQHLYLEGSGLATGENSKLTWMHNNKFYTMTAVTTANDALLLARIGANDPDFNLRREPAFIHRKNNAQNALFVSTIESHGSYSPVSEFAVNAYSNITNLEVIYNDSDYTAIQLKTDTKSKVFILVNQDNSNSTVHHLTIKEMEFNWTGPYIFKEIN